MILNNSKATLSKFDSYGPDDVIANQQAGMDYTGGDLFSSGGSSGGSYGPDDVIYNQQAVDSGFNMVQPVGTFSQPQQFPVGLYDYGNTTPMYQLGSGEVNAAATPFSLKDALMGSKTDAAIGKGVGTALSMGLGMPFGSTMYKMGKYAYDRNKETGIQLRKDLKERGFSDTEAESAIKTYYSNLSAKNDAIAAKDKESKAGEKKPATPGQAPQVATGPAPATQQQPRGMTNLGMFTIGNEAPSLVTKPKKVADPKRTLTLGNMINGGR